MKIVITGANGQLGQELVQLSLSPNLQIIGLGRDKLDITDLEQCYDVVGSLLPDVIIHCAAYTAVDKAESEPDEAFRINGEGTHNIAMAAKKSGAKLCYISTDYVFDGSGNTPYEENDPVNPQSVYGKSKLAGEQEVRNLLEAYYIVRTSWVFGKYGNNFVKTILKLAGERDELKVVSDQIGSPTYTLDLANFLIELVQTEKYGTYHASNSGTCSWFDFALAAVQESQITSVKLTPCTTAEFPRPAARPAFSVMRHTAMERVGFSDLRHWREALIHFINDSK
ncbi:dTDP-4-dehydrorhamnose reductase [Paenibacillus taihuensis]|nr:dTDP-4-dehydrorhamnose reductase [Paenibacillus taihuensis]